VLKLEKRWLLAALAALCVGAAAAQAPAATARPADTMAQRMQACTACHGAQGRATADGYYPRIAGKPEGYLYAQLLAFRDGRRRNAAMAELMAPLTDAYLREIAAHFAALDLPYPAPPPRRLSATQAQRGEQLALRGDPALKLPACAACHGAQLGGRLPGVPALLGLPPDYLMAQLASWRLGTRKALAPDCMAQVAKAMRAEDIEAVSQWLAGQTPSGLKPDPVGAPLPLACGMLP
jgi:cytochrome c553